MKVCSKNGFVVIVIASEAKQSRKCVEQSVKDWNKCRETCWAKNIDRSHEYYYQNRKKIQERRKKRLTESKVVV